MIRIKKKTFPNYLFIFDFTKKSYGLHKLKICGYQKIKIHRIVNKEKNI